MDKNREASPNSAVIRALVTQIDFAKMGSDGDGVKPHFIETEKQWRTGHQNPLLPTSMDETEDKHRLPFPESRP